ncbi:MAG: mannose-1-phosphate guanylyltransferase [Pirellulales bacterium]|nr:mannose-1-phosphate guanylyltransferase [Planctomycetales bacterium]
MLYAVIMAGGSGTRFWPESRAECPKQLLDLAGNKTMIQATVDRLAGLIPEENVLVATSARLAEAMREQLPQLPPQMILGEPCKRDTAPCIGLAAIYLGRDDPDAVMAVMPADHVIQPTAKFQEAVQQAVALVQSSPQRIVTFGITPTYAAESFGYIQRGAALDAPGGEAPAFRVSRFREKPDAATARQYLESGDFYWNSGIFVWRTATIMDALRQHQPDMYERLGRIADAWDTPERDAVLAGEFEAIKPISIDYAVMEQASDVAVIEAPFEWDDVGSWRSIARLRGSDDDGNTVSGRHVGVRTTGCIIRSSGDHLIATMGLEDCIVVHTPRATLVANKNDEESVRQLVKEIERQGLGEYL